MKNRKINLLIVILFSFIIGIISAGTSYTQTDSAKTPAELDGHRFLNNTALELPFLETYYKTLIGAGQTADLELPDIYINDKKVINLRGNVVYTDLMFVYQQQIRDWLAFNGSVNVYLKAGTEAGALISEGMNVATSFYLAWKVKTYQNKKMQLSSSLYLSRNDFTVIDLYGFVKGIIDSNGITKENKLVKSIPLTRGGLKMNYVYAFNKTFGAIANATIDYGESAYRTEGDAWNYSYGLGFEADLYPVHDVPLGFLAGFKHASIPTTREQTEKQPNILLFQFNYTGKKFLNLGAEITYQWYKPERYKDYINYIKFVTFAVNSTVYL